MGNINQCQCAPMMHKNNTDSIDSYHEIKTYESKIINNDDDSERFEINIIKYFEKYIMNKQLIYAMSIIDQFSDKINFSNHHFSCGDTPIHYAVRLHNVEFLYFLLQKGFDVCVCVVIYVFIMKCTANIYCVIG